MRTSSSIWSMVFSFMALILCRLFHGQKAGSADRRAGLPPTAE
jgi:hypothetical protein